MAVASNERKQDKMAKSFKIRLDQLDCPYTEGVDESWITELIFKPGEPRIRLLQWLFSRMDSKLSNMLDPQYMVNSTKMDSRIQRLLYIASTLGLCKYDDVDLIRGVTSLSKQRAFMDQVLDIVCIVDAADDPHTKAMTSPGKVSDAMTLDEQFTHDCWMVDVLAGQENINSVFPNDIELLPADLKRQVHKDWEKKGNAKGERPVIPGVDQLTEQAETLAQDLKRQNDMLQDVKASCTYPEEDPQSCSRVSRTMRLVLSELNQLVVGFSYVFENEMRQWCNKTPPTLSQLGPAFKRVHTLLQQFTALLHGLDNIRHSYTSVITKETSGKSVGAKSKTAETFGDISQAALESFQECITILEESMQRQDTAEQSFHTSIRLT